MEITASDLWFLGSGFVFGVSCGYAFAKILSKTHKTSRKEYKRLLAEQAQELADLRAKNALLESSLTEHRKAPSEQEYIDALEKLRNVCASKDREIAALQKRLNAFRFSR